MLWQQPPAALGLELAPAAPPRRRWWTSARAGFAALMGISLLYALATLDLDARGRPIRQAIAAWEPPTHTIDPTETLPPPLPQLIAEGWLTVYKHPEGWLLVFKSDRAFDVGQAQFRPGFLYNLDRLALAFAPWPGDIEVIGHTDVQPVRSGRFRDNQELSEARASVVAQRMRESAVPGGSRAPDKTLARQITSSGRGEREPMDAGKNPLAFERNRRVDVLWKVLPKGTRRAKNDTSTLYLPAPSPVTRP
jgi:type VI secretion system protein ImpK